MGRIDLSFIERCSLFGVSFIRGSTVYTDNRNLLVHTTIILVAAVSTVIDIITLSLFVHTPSVVTSELRVRASDWAGTSKTNIYIHTHKQ